MNTEPKRLPEEIEAPIIREARDLVAEARVKLGTNDVAVFVQEALDGAGAMFWCRTRDTIRGAIEDHLPHAVRTIAALRQPVQPDEFILVIRFGGVIESMTIEVKNTTKGVLN